MSVSSAFALFCAGLSIRTILGTDIPLGATYVHLRAQRAALLSWSSSCGYATWIYDHRWSATESPCSNGEWFGISCDSNDEEVISISLPGRYVDCSVELALGPTGINWGLFSELDSLDLSTNAIHGRSGIHGVLTASIGANLAQMQKLTVFKMPDNQIGGDLAHLNITALHSLRSLHMEGNALTGRLPRFGIMLQSLYLAHNQLSGNLNSLFHEPHLALLTISLNGNRFSGDLPPFGAHSLHPHLGTINVANNELTGSLSNAFGHGGVYIDHITFVDVRNNFLSGTFPAAVGDFNSLRKLYVQGNQLRGPLPVFAQTFTGNVNFGGSDNSSYGATHGAARHGNVYDCPIPDTRSVYDSAQCVCAPGNAAPGGHVAYPGGCDLADAPDGKMIRTGAGGALPPSCTDSGRFVCSPCALGRAAALDWSITCAACERGSHANRTGLSTCSDCAAGTFAATEGKAKCAECGPGHSSAPGATACLACAPGTTSTPTSSALCIGCQAGSFVDTSGASVCQDCGAGRFMAYSSATACEDCGTGGFASAINGSTSCTTCPEGHASSILGASSISTCVACQPGVRYANSQTFATKCAGCPEGRWSSKVGATACDMCSGLSANGIAVLAFVQKQYNPSLDPDMLPGPCAAKKDISSVEDRSESVDASSIVVAIILSFCGAAVAIVITVLLVVFIVHARASTQTTPEMKTAVLRQKGPKRGSLAAEDSALEQRDEIEAAAAPAAAPAEQGEDPRASTAERASVVEIDNPMLLEEGTPTAAQSVRDAEIQNFWG